MRRAVNRIDGLLEHLPGAVVLTQTLQCPSAIIKTFRIDGSSLDILRESLRGFLEHVRGEIRRPDLTPDLVERVFVLELDDNRKVIESLLKLALFPRDAAELVVGIDLTRIDLDRLFVMFERLGVLTAL